MEEGNKMRNKRINRRKWNISEREKEKDKNKEEYKQKTIDM